MRLLPRISGLVGFLLVVVLALHPARAGQVLEVSLEGPVDPAMARLVSRAVEQATSSGVDAIVFRINTTGGEVESALRVRDAILHARVPTVGYVTGRAWSAGALIALSCGKLAMSPGSSIGAAEPRIGGVTAGEKEMSALRSEFAATAAARGRPGELASAMVDADLDVEQAPRGKLLALGAEDAVRLRLADFLAGDAQELYRRAQLDRSSIGTVEPTWSETFSSFVTHPVVSGALLTLGLMAMAVGVLTAGTGVAEFVALLCLGLFFGGRYFAGADIWLPAALFLVGMVLIAVEVLVIPGVGVVGILGAVSVGAAVVLSFGDVRAGLTALLAATLCSAVAGCLALRYLPENPLVRRWMVLTPPPAPEPKDVEKGDPRLLLGRIGLSKSALRPGGIADFDGQRVDVRTEGDFVKPGRYIEVIKVEGTRVTVRENPGQDD